MLFDELASGEFDGLAVAVDEMGGTSEFDSGVLMADGEGDFLCEEAGIGCDDGGTDDVMIAVGEKFDKAIVEIIDFAGADFTKVDDGFLAFVIATSEVLFVEVDGSNLEKSVGQANDAAIINDRSVAFGEIGGEGETLLGGAFGRGFAADTIADGIDVFGGSFEIFVDFDTGIGEFDVSVFEPAVEIWLIAGGKGNFFDAHHFLSGAVAEDNVFANFVFADGDCFAIN